ncbi:MAG: hypothetical protein KF757_10815 [Phycisphaeraceae bacterium]|nr:hypothetical protein [Phycisphaeraceae bacterium]MBX3323472.1 hypothetical protein [Phycisphaeraceae bacterium]
MSRHEIAPGWKRHVAVCGVVLVAVSIWSLWPLAAVEFEMLAQQATEPPAAAAREALDQAAFAAPIWYVAPPPVAVAAPKPPPPPPPLKLQLIAIIYEGGSPRAVLYDPDRDAMISVGVGQEVARGRVIESIDPSTVVVRDAERTVALSLLGGGS